MKRIKKVEVWKNGRLLKKKRIFELVGDVVKVIPPPPPKSEVKIFYFRTPKELSPNYKPKQVDI